MNWGAGGRRIDSTEDHSVFVGDLAPDVTDELLLSTFSTRFSSVRGAKVRSCWYCFMEAKGLANIITVSCYQQVVIDPLTRMSKGFGFVRFGVKEEADQVRLHHVCLLVLLAEISE